jgi:hypothetical protein
MIQVFNAVVKNYTQAQGTPVIEHPGQRTTPAAADTSHK